MISFWHLLIFALILLLIMGPSRLEKMGPSLGRAIKGFKDGMAGKDEESLRLEAQREAHKRELARLAAESGHPEKKDS